MSLMFTNSITCPLLLKWNWRPLSIEIPATKLLMLLLIFPFPCIKGWASNKQQSINNNTTLFRAWVSVVIKSSRNGREPWPAISSQ